MNVLVCDPDIAVRLQAERQATDGGKHDEVWDGVYVMSPLPNVEHQILVDDLFVVIHAILGLVGGGASSPV